MKFLLFLILNACSIISTAQIIDNPVFDRTDQPSFHIDKIEMMQDTTYLHCSYYAESNSWANISPETYLEDIETGKKYGILKSEGLPLAPKMRVFIYGKKCSIKLLFPCIKTRNKINLIEDSTKISFNIYGINLKESNTKDCMLFSIEQSMALSSKADFYASLGNYTKAIEYETKAMPIKRAWLGRLSEHYEYSISMLGKYYNDIRNYEKAIEYFTEDLQLIREIAGVDYDGYAITISALANCYENDGRFTDAIKNYEKALRISETNQNVKEIDRARIVFSLANAYKKIGDIERAIKYAEESLAIKKQSMNDNDIDYIASLGLLAEMYRKYDQQKACEYAYKAVDLSKKHLGNYHPLTLKSYSNLSICYLELKQYKKAINYSNEAIRLINESKIQDNILMGTILYNVSQIYHYTQKYEKAISYYKESMDYLKNESPYYAIQIFQDVAKCYANMNDYISAINYAKKALDSIKMFALNEFKRMSPSERYLYWQDNHHFLDYEYPLYVSNNINDDNISELFNVVLYKKGITKKSEKNEEITWEDIKYHLKDDEIAIEFIAIPDLKFNSIDIYALYIRKEYVSPKMKKIFCLNEIEKINNSTKDLHNRNIKLGELIWKFLSSEENEIKNVYFSPTHCLHTLAIENLPINDLEYYCDKFNMYRLSSTGSLLATKKKCVLKNAVLFGGLFYDITPLKEQTKYSERAGFEQLYNTYDEVMDIATILNNNNILSSIYSKYDGTESCFKNLSNKPINILHLATHGMNVESADVSSLRDNNNLLFLRPDISNRPHYIENALTRSFIVLSNGNSLNNRSITEYAENDGIINALEISKLHFNQLDLVVLSACETAQGEFGYDDSVLGLQYSFKLAGTNTILMSLDKVDDEATKILMVEFYKNLMSGKTKQQSLKDAQKYLRSVENRKYDDPKYWASFIMLDGLN